MKRVSGFVLALVAFIAIGISAIYVYMDDLWMLERNTSYDVKGYMIKSYGIGILVVLLIGILIAYYSRNISRRNFLMPFIVILLIGFIYLTPMLPFLGLEIFSPMTRNSQLTKFIMNKMLFLVIFLFLGSTIYGVITNRE